MTSTETGSDTGRGRTTVAPAVVGKIAGITVRGVPGVHSVGAGASRALGALRERIPGSSGSSPATGVQVEVGERQAAVDVDVVVEYGTRIAELAQHVRTSVIRSIEQFTGLEVIEVNIAVNDIHLPSDDPEPTESTTPAGRVR